MELNALGFDRLTHFRKCYETGSVKAAAEALRLTASAVSQSLTKLEEGLRAQLFVRGPRSLLPTEKGRQLYTRSSSFVAELGSLFETNDGATVSGEIRIGAPPIFGTGPLLEMIEGFRLEYPAVSLRIALMSTNRVLEELQAGRLDFGFVDESPDLGEWNSIDVEFVAEEELVLCGVRKLVPEPLRERAGKWNELVELPLLPYHSKFEGLRKWFFHHFRRVPRISPRFSIDHAVGVLRAVRRGWGVGVVPHYLVEEDLEKGRLVAVRGPKGPFISRIGLAQLRGRTPEAAERKFLAIVRKFRGGRRVRNHR